MKAYEFGPKGTIVAGEALTKYRFVDAQGKHTVDVPAVGVTLFDAASGDYATIQLTGIAVVEAGGAITLGTHYMVSSDANGKAVALAAGTGAEQKLCGYPMDSATAAGEFIRVKLL